MEQRKIFLRQNEPLKTLETLNILFHLAKFPSLYWNREAEIFIFCLIVIQSRFSIAYSIAKSQTLHGSFMVIEGFSSALTIFG